MHAATRRSGYPADSVRPHLPLHTSGVSSVQIWPRDATPGAPAPPGPLAGHDVSPILRGPPQSLVCTSRGLAGDAICPGRPLSDPVTGHRPEQVLLPGPATIV